MDIAPQFGLAIIALLFEALVGYPDRIQRWLPHPVVWAGSLIAALERRLNRPSLSPFGRRCLGVVTLLIVSASAASAGYGAQRLCGRSIAGIAIAAILASTGLAQKSLHRHVAAVASALDRGSLAEARSSVGRIVGRDVGALGPSEIAAAGLESLAESFNDGIVAPAFWLVLAGLPGIFAYKAVNTADSMIGHREERWRDFGWMAARTDDAMNLLPARLAGALIALAGGGGWRIMARDASKHASPNAGWPEAAMAGALKVRLGGPATYDGVVAERAQLGEGREPMPADLAHGLGVYVRACALLWAIVAIGALAWPR